MRCWRAYKTGVKIFEWGTSEIEKRLRSLFKVWIVSHGDVDDEAWMFFCPDTFMISKLFDLFQFERTKTIATNNRDDFIISDFYCHWNCVWIFKFRNVKTNNGKQEIRYKPKSDNWDFGGVSKGESEWRISIVSYNSSLLVGSSSTSSPSKSGSHSYCCSSTSGSGEKICACETDRGCSGVGARSVAMGRRAWWWDILGTGFGCGHVLMCRDRTRGCRTAGVFCVGPKALAELRASALRTRGGGWLAGYWPVCFFN